MSTPTYYEVDEKALTPALCERLFEIPQLRMRRDAGGGCWLVRSPKPVPNFKGRRVVNEARWNDSLEPKPRAPERGREPSLIARAWSLAPGTRQAQIKRVPVAPKCSSLRVTFGDGRDDAVTMMVDDAALPEGATRLRLKLRVPAAVELSVQPALHSLRGRPLASLEAKSVSGPGSSNLEWPLPALAAEERARIATLSLTLSSEADAASVFLDAIEWDV